MKKELSDNVDFLHADKHETLLQIDMILIGIVKHSQSFQIESLQYLYNISKKKLKLKLIFGMQIIATVSTNWYYPF